MSSTTRYVLGVILAVAAMAAYVGLRLAGQDGAGVTIFATPFIAALLIGSKVEAVTAEQNGTLDTIRRQTNGVMDGRIRDGVRGVLAEAGIHPGIIDEPLGTIGAGASVRTADDLFPDPMAAPELAPLPVQRTSADVPADVPEPAS